MEIEKEQEEINKNKFAKENQIINEFPIKKIMLKLLEISNIKRSIII